MPTTSGHRQRLKDRFLAGEASARTDEALLELLLTYALPQRDTQPLAHDLLARFGDLDGVLAAQVEALCQFDGIKEHAAVLLKLTDWIRTEHDMQQPTVETPSATQDVALQAEMFEAPMSETSTPSVNKARKVIARRGTELFAKALLKEAIEILPRLPDTDSLDEVSRFLKTNLHFNAAQTRERYTNYVVRRMFPDGRADRALRLFAQRFAGTQDLRDACYYRFCSVEPLMCSVVDDLLLPAIGTGQLPRSRVHQYLTERYPGVSKYTTQSCSQAVVDALAAGGIAKVDRTKITFGYREVPIASFAFILHSEFPEPGMFDIAALEGNRAMRAMLWRPDRILPALYELRNLGLIVKISEIDSVRQFTTRYTLAEVVEKLL